MCELMGLHVLLARHCSHVGVFFLKCLAAVRWASSLICADSFVIGALHEEQLIVCKIKK